MVTSGVLLENTPALTMTPLETRFASLSGKGRASQRPRRFALCCAVALQTSTVDGPLVNQFFFSYIAGQVRDMVGQPPLVNQADSCQSLRRNHTWCHWDAHTIVDRCVVEDTEETKEHKRVLTLLLLATLSMLHSGNILPSRAT